jgi:hypothetical protein
MTVSWTYNLTSGSSVGIGSLDTTDTQELQYAELALDPTTGDVLLPIQIIRGAEAVAQRIRVRFRFFLGEWFLDTRLGVPYYRDILIKNPDSILIGFIFRQVLLTTPGVKSVASFSASLERATRTLTVTFEAQLEDGTELRAVAEPFIIG